MDSILNAFTTPLPVVGFSAYQLVLFLAILLVGVLAVKVVARLVKRSLERFGAPPLVTGLLTSITRGLGYIVVVITALPVIGVDTSTVGLGLSAIIGLILGFGLQDTWANMAAGVWLAVTRPFDKGEYVEVSGYSGIIDGIGLMTTTLKTFDNVVITIPNKKVWGAPVVNYSREPTRRVTLDIDVAYGTDLSKAIDVTMGILKAHPKVLDDPEPAVVVTQLKDSSINLQVRAWARKEDYGTVKADLIRGIYEEFRKAGIEIPYPQLDVHIRDMPTPKA